jgi:hypothetical protein
MDRMGSPEGNGRKTGQQFLLADRIPKPEKQKE